MVHRLAGHTSLGWDMDETLVNGPHSVKWRTFVKENPHLDHWVVTFRSKNEALQVWDELESEYMCPLDRSLFKGLLFMPDRVRLPFDTLPTCLANYDFASEPSTKVLRALAHYKLTLEDLKARRKLVHDWKATACVELGATVMVDDLEHVVKNGCVEHGVVFVNSLE